MKTVVVLHSRSDYRAARQVEDLSELLLPHGVGVKSSGGCGEPRDGPDGLHASIKKADMVVAYVLEGERWMFFELGIAYAANRPLLLVSSDPKSIPMGLQQYRFISPRHGSNFLCDSILETLHDSCSPLTTQLPSGQTNRELLKMLSGNPEAVDQISEHEFSDIVRRCFEEQGFDVSDRSEVLDGFDFTVERAGGLTLAIELKKYKSTSRVSVPVVRSLVGSMVVSGIRHGVIVSTAPYTSSAQYFSTLVDADISLLRVEDLLDLDNSIASIRRN